MAEWVYDRTISDVVNGTSKGFINYQDLNRIENAMQELEEELCYYSYTLGEILSLKTTWHKAQALGQSSLANIPTLEHLNRIAHNVNVLRNAFFTYQFTPQAPTTLENATYRTFNDLEQILHDLHMMVESMEENFVECDTFYCNEEYS